MSAPAELCRMLAFEQPVGRPPHTSFHKMLLKPPSFFKRSMLSGAEGLFFLNEEQKAYFLLFFNEVEAQFFLGYAELVVEFFGSCQTVNV